MDRLKNVRMSTIVWVTLSTLFLFLGRLCVPTHIEWTVNAFYKDMAHLFLGVLFCYCWMRRGFPIYITGIEEQKVTVVTEWKPHWRLFLFAWVLSFFELGMALLTK